LALGSEIFRYSGDDYEDFLDIPALIMKIFRYSGDDYEDF